MRPFHKTYDIRPRQPWNGETDYRVRVDGGPRPAVWLRDHRGELRFRSRNDAIAFLLEAGLITYEEIGA